MANAATLTAGGTNANTAPRGNTQNVPVPVVPFIRASQEHREQSGIDVSRVMTASDQDLGVFDINAYGYLRSVIILVQATGGSGTSVTAAEDGPWSALKNITIQEPNGATIFQVNSGYELYVINKYGGYRFANECKTSPAYTAVAGGSGNFQFLLRIPLEISLRDALGSLPNQNSAATFKLRLTLAASTQIYGTVPGTTLPTVRVRVWIEAWDQPEMATAGASNQTTPPALNTTQYWSVQTYAVNAARMSVRLTRMGNYIRNFLFIFRGTSNTRTNGDANFPDPLTLTWDTRPVDQLERNNWLHQIYERYGYAGTADAAGARDLGVFPYDFCHEFDGQVGHENRDLWLPTLGSTRFEVDGTWGQAGTLTVLTNDISVAGTVFI